MMEKLKKPEVLLLLLQEQILPLQAVEMEDPLEAERYLTRIRLDFLETLRPADSFSETMLFYYALKLKLILRLQRFDKSRGQSAYREIYSAIMHGGDQEVKE